MTRNEILMLISEIHARGSISSLEAAALRTAVEARVYQVSPELPPEAKIPLYLLSDTEVGHKILARRRALGLSQHDLAIQAGVTQATISRWERGQQRPEYDAMVRMDAILKLEAPLVLS